jgi:SAM-dependent methyltransferase
MSKAGGEWDMASMRQPLQILRRAANRALTSQLVGRVIGVRLTSLNRADDFCNGRGIEIGALSCPFPFTHATVRYADVATVDEIKGILADIPIDNLYVGKFAEPDILLKPPRFELTGVSNGEVDFVYSSHSLEHAPNPIFAISDALRVTKPGGHVYMIIPNREQTYDVERRTTPAAELIRKYESGIFDYTFEEALDVVENTVNHPLYEGKGRVFAEEILQTNTGIHHFHTFDPSSMVEILDYCQSNFGCQVLYFCAEGQNIHFCLLRY